MAEFETSFADLGLAAPIIQALTDLGYEKPSPIQAECIPHLLNGRDVLGMAQTGSGKTAAFSLPLLHNIDPSLKAPQVLVLAPTRELAVQVSEAMADFAKHMNGVNVVALYGGQRYDVQLRALRRWPTLRRTAACFASGTTDCCGYSWSSARPPEAWHPEPV